MMMDSAELIMWYNNTPVPHPPNQLFVGGKRRYNTHIDYIQSEK